MSHCLNRSSCLLPPVRFGRGWSLTLASSGCQHAPPLTRIQVRLQLMRMLSFGVGACTLGLESGPEAGRMATPRCRREATGKATPICKRRPSSTTRLLLRVSRTGDPNQLMLLSSCDKQVSASCLSSFRAPAGRTASIYKRMPWSNTCVSLKTPPIREAQSDCAAQLMRHAGIDVFPVVQSGRGQRAGRAKVRVERKTEGELAFCCCVRRSARSLRYEVNDRGVHSQGRRALGVALETV